MRRITVIILLLLAAFLVTQAAFSLQWPIAHDEAPLFYEAFLMQSEGRIPYRDIFDFQMPGSYIVYYLLGMLSGFGPFRIRILDMLILAALIVITFQAMRRFGKTSALAAGILFGLKYLQGGPSLSLQREYLLLVLIALSLLIGMRDSLTPKHRLSLGILFGLSAVIKPHAALGLLPFLLFDIADIRQRPNMSLPKAAWTSILPAAIGFAIPISLVIAWLALAGALTPFLTIALNYWPLYSQINGQMEITPAAERISFLLNQIWRLGGSGLWLIPAAFGIYLNRNRQTYLLASLALCYAIYPALSGQFFPYHYIPFIYIIILVASLSLTTHHFPLSTSFILHLSSLILLLFLIRPSTTFLRQLQGQPIATSTDRAEEIARFLEKNLEAGETVQPLDWTGGTLLAMLETRTPIATPYVFDFYFYHHVSNPYIQSLRVDFMHQLQSASPRYIVEVTSIDKPWVSGEDTTREFPELRAFLNEYYSVTIQKDDYTIYELDGIQ
ncbi:MAG: glycosyltransferase family 39 protein [Anaerolineales bacterium]|nr:glycosyltransferase family 39 protein [Anaerolineales bacterium]